MTAEDEFLERELMRSRFQRLIGELLRGSLVRTTFSSWEMEILADIGASEINPRRRIGILRQYAKAVDRQLDSGPGPPMTLSGFLQLRSTRRPAK